MKIKDIREQSSEELAVLRRELREETLNLRIQQESGQLENPARIRNIRRDVARISTILGERRQEAAVPASQPEPTSEEAS